MCSPDDIGPTFSEEFRSACEARYVANLGTNEERTAFLSGVAARRGVAAADQLRRGAWAAMRAAA
jgi:hypothetical protein